MTYSASEIGILMLCTTQLLPISQKRLGRRQHTAICAYDVCKFEGIQTASLVGYGSALAMTWRRSLKTIFASHNIMQAF